MICNLLSIVGLHHFKKNFKIIRLLCFKILGLNIRITFNSFKATLFVNLKQTDENKFIPFFAIDYSIS